jgi:RHS repeat-associated protein
MAYSVPCSVDNSQATHPADNDFVAISAGGWHSLALKSDGSVVGWGDNCFGQTSPSGLTIVERYSYDAFGQPTIKDVNGTIRTASALGNRFMFTGREYDSETGNYYYRARYYKPSIGRFLQTDPIGYAGGLNLYTYCGNNPVVFTDPSGQLWKGVVGGVCIGIGGYMIEHGMIWGGVVVGGIGIGLEVWEFGEIIHKPPSQKAFQNNANQQQQLEDWIDGNNADIPANNPKHCPQNSH